MKLRLGKIIVAVLFIAVVAATTITFSTLYSNKSKTEVDSTQIVYSRVVVDASVYRGLMQMLGVGDKCIDFSNQMRPDVERIAASKPDLIMLSAYDGMDLSRYERLGIKVEACRDFMETSPLGRAKWMKHYGALWGVAERADSLYKLVEEGYKSSIARVKKTIHRPSVMFDLMYGSVWYQPAMESSMGGIVIDAGGRMPFKSKQHGGSLALSEEQVLFYANDVDVWIIRYQDTEPLTLNRLRKLNPAYSRFKAFKNGNVWVVDTNKVPYFDEAPFRPDFLVEDLINILHPECSKTKRMRYFTKLK